MTSTTLVALFAAALMGQHVVVVPLDALDPGPETPEGIPVDVLVDRVDVLLEPGDETRVELTWTLSALEETWIDLALMGNDLALTTATLDGRPVALPPGPDGHRRLTARLSGQHTVRVTGTAATLDRRLDLPLLAASRGLLVAAAPGLEVEVEGALEAGENRFDLPPLDRLQATWRPAVPRGDRPLVISAETGTTLRIDEGGMEGRALLRYRIRHGDVETLTFSLPAGAESLEIDGTAVRSFTRRGDQVLVELTRPMHGAVALDIRFRSTAPDGDDARSAPLPVAGDGAGWLTVLRGDEALVVPEPSGALEPVASRALPRWARGLADGETVATYRVTRRPALSVRVLRYDPVEQPPTLIDEARYEVAYSEHGRLMLRARYQVRNDRNQYLHVVPPEGFRLLGALVTGVAVQPVSDGDRGVYVPLEKSIETLHGLVAFPVEVLFLGEEDAWTRRGRRTLTTPAVDAPVAYARWEVILPPGVDGDGIGGGATAVEHWTDQAAGLTYGRAHGVAQGVTRGVAYELEIEEDEEFPEPGDEEVWVMARTAGPALTPRPRKKPRASRGGFGFGMAKAAPPPIEAEPARDALLDERRRREDLSQDSWNQAYSAYKTNAFDEAQGLLHESLQHDPSNPQAQALLANVDLLLGQGDDEDEGGDWEYDIRAGSTSNTSRSGSSQGGEVVARRVREMARARTGSTQIKQDKLKKKAEEAYRAGDVETAAREFQALVEVTEELAQVEQAESFDQKLALEEYEVRLQEMERRVDEEREKAYRSKARLLLLEESMIVGTIESSGEDRDRSTVELHTSPDGATVVYEPVTEVDFDSVSIDAALRAPGGAAPTTHWAPPEGTDTGWGDELPPDAHVLYDMPVDATLPMAGELLVERNAFDDAFEDLDGIEIADGEMALVFEDPTDPEPDVTAAYEPQATTARPLSVIGHHRGVRHGGGGLGKAGGKRAQVTATTDAKPRNGRGEAPAGDAGRTLDRGDQTIRVTAATLSTEIPRAGTSLLFEQRLVPENEPLTAELRFRSSGRRSR